MSNDRIARAHDLWQRFPDNELARYSLAQSYFDANDFASAAEHLRPLCAKKPEWMVVHILLGKCLLAAGEPAEAKRLFAHAHQLAIAQHHNGPREELEDLLKTL